jgi:hypothetical protein
VLCPRFLLLSIGLPANLIDSIMLARLGHDNSLADQTGSRAIYCPAASGF